MEGLGGGRTQRVRVELEAVKLGDDDERYRHGELSRLDDNFYGVEVRDEAVGVDNERGTVGRDAILGRRFGDQAGGLSCVRVPLWSLLLLSRCCQERSQASPFEL